MDETFTIDELAALTGVPTRTIRQYQTLGLLAPPKRVGRIGRYDGSHRERLAAIGGLQERGYSLAGMRDLFEAWNDGRELRAVIGGPNSQPQPPVDEAPMTMTTEQLAAAVPSFAREANRRKAVQAGLLTPGATKESWFVRSPAALTMIADLMANGLAVGNAVGFYAHLSEALDALGADVAAGLVGIKPASGRAALLQRNRPLLGRTVATLLMTAIGNALPVEETDRVRIGAVRQAGAGAKPPAGGRRPAGKRPS